MHFSTNWNITKWIYDKAEVNKTGPTMKGWLMLVYNYKKKLIPIIKQTEM